MASAFARMVRRASPIVSLAVLAGGLASCFTPTSSSSSGAASHLHVQLNSTNVTIDCTRYDNNQETFSSSLITSGGESQSTSETFGVYLPNSAAALRDPSALARYPIGEGSSVSPPVAYEIQLTLYDPPEPEPNTVLGWESCAPGDCGTPNPDPDHYHEITAITEQAPGTQGMATFRVSGSFVALVTKPQTGGGPTTATATGDWSLLVTVPDPGQ